MKSNGIMNLILQRGLKTLQVKRELGEKKNGASLSELLDVKKFILPFRLLPDVKNVQIKTSYLDPLFEAFGVKRNSRKAELDVETWRNRRYNRYIIFQLRYLKKVNDRKY
jgi:hypothetical protein